METHDTHYRGGMAGMIAVVVAVALGLLLMGWLDINLIEALGGH